jgi:hypothetical protein
MDTNDLSPRAARIVLEVDPDDEPIRGVLRPEIGRPVPFTGWLELTRLLERLITQAGQHSGG